MNLKFRDKVEIKWIDSCQNHTSWIYKKDIEAGFNFQKSLMKIKSVGQFVLEDDEVIGISHSINETSESILSLMFIPKVAILEIKKL